MKERTFNRNKAGLFEGNFSWGAQSDPPLPLNRLFNFAQLLNSLFKVC